VFLDRLLATLVHLRHGVTHNVLACWLAERGCTVEGGSSAAHPGRCGRPSRRPQAGGLLDATEVRVRRPAAGRAGRQRFVSGKARANTVKALVITDPAGRLLCCGQTRAGLHS
jgi:hypothetical protein